MVGRDKEGSLAAIIKLQVVQSTLRVRKQENPMSPDYVPSVFAHTPARQRQRNMYASSRFEQTQQMKQKRSETVAPTSCNHPAPAPSTTSDAAEQDTIMDEQDTTTDEQDTTTNEHNYSQVIQSPGITGACSNVACQATFRALTDECTQLRTEVHHLRKRVDERSLNEDAFKGKDDMVQELTGLPSYAKLMVVFTFLSGFLKAGPNLTPFNSFVLTLMRMRLNLPLYFFCLFLWYIQDKCF
ncbi:hypothetical protein N1851_026934 [Merluccius polli]|uniref:Uncharacterized protein n=1 Tax=Merluccius polli TaxID=89951 RepID=A0AA47NUR6_MERPO|nr:hypothetical protein N1851_026934 [Merluccius polli]